MKAMLQMDPKLRPTPHDIVVRLKKLWFIFCFFIQYFDLKKLQINNGITWEVKTVAENL